MICYVALRVSCSYVRNSDDFLLQIRADSPKSEWLKSAKCFFLTIIYSGITGPIYSQMKFLNCLVQCSSLMMDSSVSVNPWVSALVCISCFGVNLSWSDHTPLRKWLWLKLLKLFIVSASTCCVNGWNIKNVGKIVTWPTFNFQNPRCFNISLRSKYYLS